MPYPEPQNDDCEIPSGSRLKGGPTYYQTIWCEGCGAEGGKRQTAKDAIAAWNLRTTETQSSPSPLPERGAVEELAEIILPATYTSGSREERAEFSREIAGRVIAAGWAYAPALKAALEETRRLVGKCVESGFADDDDIRALFVNNGKITDALARAGGAKC